MNVNRWVTGWLAVAALVGGQGLPRAPPPPGGGGGGRGDAAEVGGGGRGGPARGQGSESAGMITELKVDRGRVEVRPAGAQEWRKAGPLLALRAGDTIRVSDEAGAGILLSGGRGSVRVTKANSPYVVAAPQPGESKAQKALTLLEASLGFLSTTAKEE